MGYFSRAIRADIEKGSRYFRRSDNTPFGRNAAAEVSVKADKRGRGFHLSAIKEKNFQVFFTKDTSSTAIAVPLLPLEKAGKNPCFRQRRYWINARATRFSAGVQTMRARICSVFSCDMFARVVV